MPNFFLARSAEKDLRCIGPGPDRNKLLAGLGKLAENPENMDVKILQGAPPWLRCRIGNYRILYWLTREGTFEIDEIIHRRDLHTAVAGISNVDAE